MSNEITADHIDKIAANNCEETNESNVNLTEKNYDNSDTCKTYNNKKNHRLWLQGLIVLFGEFFYLIVDNQYLYLLIMR